MTIDQTTLIYLVIGGLALFVVLRCRGFFDRTGPGAPSARPAPPRPASAPVSPAISSMAEGLAHSIEAFRSLHLLKHAQEFEQRILKAVEGAVTQAQELKP